MSRVADAVRELASCPRCQREAPRACATPTGRNHPERVQAAIREALYREGIDRGIDRAALRIWGLA